MRRLLTGAWKGKLSEGWLQEFGEQDYMGYIAQAPGVQCCRAVGGRLNYNKLDCAQSPQAEDLPSSCSAARAAGKRSACSSCAFPAGFGRTARKCRDVTQDVPRAVLYRCSSGATRKQLHIMVQMGCGYTFFPSKVCKMSCATSSIVLPRRLCSSFCCITHASQPIIYLGAPACLNCARSHFLSPHLPPLHVFMVNYTSSPIYGECAWSG